MFRSFRGPITDEGANVLPGPPAKKRRCLTTNASRTFKKGFDLAPSTLLDHSPSLQKSMPFKSMIAGWWLETHPMAKILPGAAWLEGFYSCLEEEDLHSIDRDYMKELVAWHEEREALSWLIGGIWCRRRSLCQTGCLRRVCIALVKKRSRYQVHL